MRNATFIANWLLNESIDNLKEDKKKEIKFPLTIKFPDFTADEPKHEKAFATKEAAIESAKKFGVELKGYKTSPNECPEFGLKFSDEKSLFKFLAWLGLKKDDVEFSNTRSTVVIETTNGKVKLVNEAEELDTDDEDEESDIDVDAALKIVNKIGKLAEKNEDEKLEKLVADLKKALGVEDEEEETEEVKEKKPSKKGGDDDLGDISDVDEI